MPTFGPSNPDRDTLIESLNPTYNYGQRNTLWLDWFNPGGARFAIAWDVSSIPLGAVVSSAMLDLVIQANTLPGSTAFSAYAMNFDSLGVIFTEGSGSGSATGDGATWDTINGVDNWIDPGAGSDIYVPSASAFTSAPSETTKSIDVKTAIQAALDDYRDPSGLIALLLKRDNESGLANSLRFWSNQAATPANRPVLTISYSMGSTTMTLTGAGK